MNYLFMYVKQMFLWCLMWVFILSTVFPLCVRIHSYLAFEASYTLQITQNLIDLFLYLSFRCILEIAYWLHVRLSVNIGAEAK